VRFPFVSGIEAAGVVEAVEPTGDQGLIGQPIVHFGYMAGAYADYTAAPAAHVVPLDPCRPPDAAAAVAVSGTTAHVLTRTAVAGAGRTFVAHAAAGSARGAIVQLATAAGTTAIAITSTGAQAESARGLGAQYTMALDNEADPVLAVRRTTDGLVRAGWLSARIAGRFPLRDAAVAHARLADRSVPGKLLLMTSFGGDACAS
jgi:NADPH2:quinone reductase